MELSQFEKDLGLQDCRGSIEVGANIWTKKDTLVRVSVNTTRRAFHNAVKSDKRYSMEKTMQLIASGNKTEGLQALTYRAKVSDAKGLAIREAGAVHLGVMQR